MNYLSGLAIIIMLLTFSSCRKDHIRGNGSVITESRTVSNFTSVQTNGDIRVYITRGAHKR